MEKESAVSTDGSISTKVAWPKVLRNIFFPGDELKPFNGHIRSFYSNGMLIGHLNDFIVAEALTPELSKSDCLVVFDKVPDPTAKFVIKKTNCFTLRLSVEPNQI